MDSTQSTTGDVSSKQLPRARDQISQLVEQFHLNLHDGDHLVSVRSTSSFKCRN